MSLLAGVRWLSGAGFLLEDGLVVYLDPCGLPPGLPRADIVLLTHDHPGHLSTQDVLSVSAAQTVVAGPASCVSRFRLNQLPFTPGQSRRVLGLEVTAVPAYVPGDPRHARENGGFGFLLESRGRRLFHSGDTARIPEHEGLRADVALLPVGAGWLDAEDALALARLVGARAALPMHCPPGGMEAAEFVRLAGEAGLESFLPVLDPVPRPERTSGPAAGRSGSALDPAIPA